MRRSVLRFGVLGVLVGITGCGYEQTIGSGEAGGAGADTGGASSAGATASSQGGAGGSPGGAGKGGTVVHEGASGAGGLGAPTCEAGLTYLEQGCSDRGVPIEPGCYQRCRLDPTAPDPCPTDSLCRLTTIDPCYVCEVPGCCDDDACGMDAWVCLPVPEACDDASREAVVLSAENSFGMCTGECRFLLEVASGAEEAGACDSVRLSVLDGSAPEPRRINDGVLTPLGHARARTLALALEATPLKDLYGCPDCADGGASRVTLARLGIESSHSYEYGQPPDEFVQLDAFVQAIVRGLRDCTSNDLVVVGENCTP